MDRVKKKKQKPATTAQKTVVAGSQSVVLTDEQMHIAEQLLKCEKQVQSLGGLAGTGKTTLVSYLSKQLPDYAFCAFTGKAADVLRTKGVLASTIHSLIYTPTDEKDKYGSPIFERKYDIACKGIIVDEASMVGRNVYHDLISYDLPVIFVGDHGQLEPVGEDMYLMANPDYKLETVHRNAGDIAKFAHHLRMGQRPIDYEHCDAVKIVKKSQCGSLLLDADQIICAFNATRVSINKYVRQLKGLPEDFPIAGDRVISLLNSRKYGIYNGTQGIIRTINSRTLTLKGNKYTIQYNPSTFLQEKIEKTGMMREHPFDYAYAITCHKAQGSEWDKLLVLEQYCSKWDHKRWTYTAASRAKKELIWVIPD